MFVIHFHMKFRIPASNGPLVIVCQTKSEMKIFAAAMSFFYSLQNNAQTTVKSFLKIRWHTSVEDPILAVASISRFVHSPPYCYYWMQ